MYKALLISFLVLHSFFTPIYSQDPSQEQPTTPLMQEIEQFQEEIQPDAPEFPADRIATPEVPTRNYFLDFLYMLFLLSVMIAFLYGLAWFLRRMSFARDIQMNASSGIKVLERRQISSKSLLYILDIYGKKIAISESPTGVNYLTDLPEELFEEQNEDEMDDAKTKK